MNKVWGGTLQSEARGNIIQHITKKYMRKNHKKIKDISHKHRI